MKIQRATEATDELVEALARLIPQLTRSRQPPSWAELQELVQTQTLLVARGADGKVTGTLTLVLYRIPTGLRARIDDVVVDEACRGQGIGEALTEEAVRLAREGGALTVELTSHPSREGANRLYRHLGFEQRETNVYRLRL